MTLLLSERFNGVLLSGSGSITMRTARGVFRELRTPVANYGRLACGQWAQEFYRKHAFLVGGVRSFPMQRAIEVAFR